MAVAYTEYVNSMLEKELDSAQKGVDVRHDAGLMNQVRTVNVIANTLSRMNAKENERTEYVMSAE